MTIGHARCGTESIELEMPCDPDLPALETFITGMGWVFAEHQPKYGVAAVESWYVAVAPNDYSQMYIPSASF